MATAPEPIAIVGMACVFPGAADLAAYWSNLQAGVDAISEVPPGRWDPVFLDAAHPAIDRLYCRRGGFIDAQATFDPLTFGVMPSAAEGAEPDQLLTLQVAHAALLDAGLEGEGAWRRCTGVVIGRGGYPTPGLVRLEQRVRTAQQLVEILRDQAPELSESRLQALKEAFQHQFGAFGPDTAIGLVPNLAASRVANRLDLEGPAYTVDAACASSLVAVDQACRELWSGRCEVALAGGVHLCQDVTFWSVFTQLGALSRSGIIRPFDRRADGLLIGEGVGLVVLKRLADAQRADDRIYATIRGVGISSDGRGTTLLNPRVEGQLLALERAWAEAGIDRATIGMVEAHGTGTGQGDAAELSTLGRFFGPASSSRPPAWLGSVKSMIGHAMPAAGAAGLIKSALALHHGLIPPSLHCEEPHPLLAETRFEVPPVLRPWPEAGPRRAAVNAFGFGGINAHVVLEAPSVRPSALRHPSATVPPPRAAEAVLALAAPTREALLASLIRGGTHPGEGPCRLVVFDPTPERLERARTLVEKGKPWQGHQDFWFAESGLLATGGKVAFLFPGLEPTFTPNVDEVAAFLGRPPPAAPASKAIEATGVAVVEVGRLLARALRSIGIEPDAYAGHSVGEWTGMIASGMIPATAAEAFIDSVVPGGLEIPDVVFAAAGCSVLKAQELIAHLRGLHVSHDNCPHQVILCGPPGAMDEALVRLRHGSVLAQLLPFRSGFHSPSLAPFLELHRSHFARLPLERPRHPLWSATICAPYPDDPAEIRTLALEHLVQPVRFRELTERMYAEGFRLFIQVGAGSSLTGFVSDTLRGKPHLAMASNVRQRPGLAQLHRVAAALFCEGGPDRLSAFASARPRVGKPLRLDVPLVRMPRVGPILPAAAGSPAAVVARFTESLRHLEEAQGKVVAALRGANVNPGPRSWTHERTISLESDPYLLDHCFYRQPEGWPEASDRFPIVPMTLLVEWMRKAAEAAAGRHLDRVEEVRALRWLAAAPPAETTTRTQLRDDGSYEVVLEGHAKARLIPQSSSAPVWSAPPALAQVRAIPVAAEDIYRQRWMFHGPGYQGIRRIDSWGSDGVDAELETPSAPGALLDNAGQVLGLWVMLHTQVDRMAFPVAMESVQYFGPDPRPGERLRCGVRVLALDERGVRANVWLWHTDGRPFCCIEGWEDRRFDSTPRLWDVLRWPERHLLAVPRPEGYFLTTDAWRNLPSRELISRRYLGVRERAQMEAMPAREQGAWLNGRIAVKDAVRDYLWRQGHGPLFPIEIEVVDDPEGRPSVRGPLREPLQVSLSVVEGGAVARVVSGRAVGIGLDHAEAASAERTAPSLSPEERLALPAGPTWPMRVGVAKEALGKALRQLGGSAVLPGPLEAVEGDQLRLGGKWVRVVQDGPFLVGWSELS